MSNPPKITLSPHKTNHLAKTRSWGNQGIPFDLVIESEALEPAAGILVQFSLAPNLCIVSEPRLIGERHLKICLAGPQGPTTGDDLLAACGETGRLQKRRPRKETTTL